MLVVRLVTGPDAVKDSVDHGACPVWGPKARRSSVTPFESTGERPLSASLFGGTPTRAIRQSAPFKGLIRGNAHFGGKYVACDRFRALEHVSLALYAAFLVYIH